MTPASTRRKLPLESDEVLGREICRLASTNTLVLASIGKFARLYTIDLKVLDPTSNEYTLRVGRVVEIRVNR